MKSNDDSSMKRIAQLLTTATCEDLSTKESLHQKPMNAIKENEMYMQKILQFFFSRFSHNEKIESNSIQVMWNWSTFWKNENNIILHKSDFECNCNGEIVLCTKVFLKSCVRKLNKESKAKIEEEKKNN